jgi:hypothetical protein
MTGWKLQDIARFGSRGDRVPLRLAFQNRVTHTHVSGHHL